MQRAQSLLKCENAAVLLIDESSSVSEDQWKIFFRLADSIFLHFPDIPYWFFHLLFPIYIFFKHPSTFILGIVSMSKWGQSLQVCLWVVRWSLILPIVEKSVSTSQTNYKTTQLAASIFRNKTVLATNLPSFLFESKNRKKLLDKKSKLIVNFSISLSSISDLKNGLLFSPCNENEISILTCIPGRLFPISYEHVPFLFLSCSYLPKIIIKKKCSRFCSR